MVHGGAIGVAERGCFIPDWNGEMELGVGDGSAWKIARMRSRTDRRATLEEVEVEASGAGWGVVYACGGFVVESVNINWRLEHVDVDGTCGTSGRGISFGRYEERL